MSVIIGLTGGIASGKSTVTDTLKKMGACIINMDEIAHKLMEPGEPLYKMIIEHFGTHIVADNGKIDRNLLGTIIYNDDKKRLELDEITHPLIIAEADRIMDEYLKKQKNAIIVVEIPLLYEIKLDDTGRYDEIWVVWIDRECQIERLIGRDGCTREEAEAKLNSQMDLTEKAKRADFVINNMNSREDAVIQIEEHCKMFSGFKQIN